MFGINYANTADLELSHNNNPILCERGYGMSNTGFAWIICRSDGNPKKAIFTKIGMYKAHAGFPAEVGDIVIHARHSRQDGMEIRVFRLDSIHRYTYPCEVFNKDYTAVEIIEKPAAEGHFTRLHWYKDGEWDSPIPKCLERAVRAAQDKSRTYHCRVPFWYA